VEASTWFFDRRDFEKRGLPPETLIVHFCSLVQPFKRKSIVIISPCTKTLPKSTKKDNFHNPILALTGDILVIKF
jgi:hypothetical protein